MISGGVNTNSLVFYALIATLGTWFVTALGSATVIFFKSPKTEIMDFMLGFASGVMIAASFWSLLQPAIELAEKQSEIPAYLTSTVGFLFGAVFMWLSDKIVTSAGKYSSVLKGRQSTKTNRILMLIFSITLHNIPEGLAVGVAFGALQNNPNADGLMGAVTIAIGIGLQNFPEGIAVALPLKREGFSSGKSFFIGQASGMVEPVAGVLGSLAVVYITSILPYALSFAAGAMILVAVHELIPECQKSNETHPYLSTSGIIFGFAVMMLLDVMLG